MKFRMTCKNYLNVSVAKQLLHFFRIPLEALVALGTVFLNNLAIYLNDFLSLTITALKSVASSLE